MNGGEIAAEEQVENQLRIATIVFLPPADELANGQRVADAQKMAELFDQTVEPERIAAGFHTDDGSGSKLRVKGTHVVRFMIERALVHFRVGGVHPADGLGAYTKSIPMYSVISASCINRCQTTSRQMIPTRARGACLMTSEEDGRTRRRAARMAELVFASPKSRGGSD
jgi:hypothetical protein